MSLIRKTYSEKVFDVFNYLLMTVFMFTILYPFWNLFVVSINSQAGSNASFLFLPQKFTLANYEYVLKNKYIWIGYRETIIRTVCGTFLSVLFTAIGAYVLSKRSFPNRKFWMIMVVVPMFFNGGLIPNYIWNITLGLRDSRLALILPGLISSYNLIIMRNFFIAIPQELEESARIDGAGSLNAFFRIIIPVSKAVIATITLWVMVGHWNAWFDATIYINNAMKFPLQVVLRRILLEGTQQLMDINPHMSDANITVSPDTLKASTVFIVIIPIICVYPFLQKYFVKGVMIGSVKG